MIGKIKKGIPPPNKYKVLENWKSQCGKRTTGCNKHKETLYNFIDETTFLSKKIPGSNKYKIHDLEFTKNRTVKANFNDKSTKRIGERMTKIEKASETDLQAYEAFKKSQLAKIYFSNDRAKRVSYFDEKVAQKKFIPGVGAYHK